MRRLIISLIVVVLAATIGLGWMFDNVIATYLEAPTATRTNNDAISELESLGSHIAKTLNNVENPQQFVSQWPVADTHKMSLVAADKYPLPQPLIDTLTFGQSVMLETDVGLSLYFLLQNHQQLLVIEAPSLITKPIDSSLRIILTSVFYLTMMLLMLAWLYPLLRRLLTLRLVAKAFGEGDLSQRVNVSSVTYIRDLETEFNHMAQRIESLVSDVKLLSNAVSHDLRTPLSRIRFGLDTLAEEDDPKFRKRFQQRISDNVDEMVDLVETLLNYARLDQSMVNIEKRQVPLSPLITSCIKTKLNDNMIIEFDNDKSDDKKCVDAIAVDGDPAYLMILINNLLQNALNYGHSKVIVSIKTVENSIVLGVEDDGEGIAFEDRAKIVKPFIRGNDSEQSIKGYGMGLAIVTRILQWHQGSLTIGESKLLGGAEFKITLPKF
jgi:two-component system OmpR family sensor kinase